MGEKTLLNNSDLPAKYEPVLTIGLRTKARTVRVAERTPMAVVLVIEAVGVAFAWLVEEDQVQVRQVSPQRLVL